MSVLNRIPENTNPIQPTKFLLTFDRIGSVTYFCQTVKLPGVSMGQAPINTPLLDIQAPGNKLSFNPFSVGFIVDEELVGWQQIYEWFNSMSSPKSLDYRKSLAEKQNEYKGRTSSYSDATLTIISALNNPIVRIQFYNVFPISLSDIDFDTTQSADNIITAEVSFVYDYFEFLPIN
jgi:hypothetical protein